MARHNAPSTETIYEVANQWLLDVLPTGGSLLTPTTQIWTTENLQDLLDRFIGHPDATAGKSFLGKLEDQLRDASPDVIQLMAEAHAVTFLWVWNGAISSQKKLSDIKAILSWHPDRPGVPEHIAQAMSPGLVHPGQWAMTRRYTQLGGILHVALAFTQEPDKVKQHLLNDPWAFRDFVMAVPAYGADNAKHALVHIAFPETFEAIVAPKHKEWISNRFSGLAGDEQDVDKRLLTIRAALEPTYGPGFSYYDEDTDPLVHLWWKNEKLWPATLKWARKLWESVDHDAQERDYKLVIAEALQPVRLAVLQDDTSWVPLMRDALAHRINNLMSWRDRDTFLKWMEIKPDEAASTLRSLWSSKEESKGLDEFAETLRDAGITAPGASLNLGSMLLMAEDVEDHPPLKVSALRLLWKLTNWKDEPAGSTVGRIYERGMAFLDEVLASTATWPTQPRDRLDVQGLLWTLARIQDRPPAWSEVDWEGFQRYRGGALLDDRSPAAEDEDDAEKPVEDPIEATVDQIELAAKDLSLDRSELDRIVTLLEDKGQVVLYGPPGTGKTFLARRLARGLVEGDESRMRVVQFHPATTYEDFFEGLRPELVNGQVHYSLREGPLTALARAARQNRQRRYVMVIDELNRANIPKVFGELLYLLEYRNDKVATLYRAQEQFELPENLLFIATMNTADRSVALVDAALRRRFHFIPFFPHSGPMKDLLRRWLSARGHDTAVADLLDAVNEDLLNEVGPHMLIGPSHFMKQDRSEEALRRIWEFSIFPTLEELLWGREEALKYWKWTSVRQRYASQLKLAPTQEPEHEPISDGVGTPPETTQDAN